MSGTLLSCCLFFNSTQIVILENLSVLDLAVSGEEGLIKTKANGETKRITYAVNEFLRLTPSTFTRETTGKGIELVVDTTELFHSIFFFSNVTISSGFIDPLTQLLFFLYQATVKNRFKFEIITVPNIHFCPPFILVLLIQAKQTAPHESTVQQLSKEWAHCIV